MAINSVSYIILMLLQLNLGSMSVTPTTRNFIDNNRDSEHQADNPSPLILAPHPIPPAAIVDIGSTPTSLTDVAEDDDCPSDSQLINDKCECLPCQTDICAPKKQIKIKESTEIPGQCCPIYKCVDLDTDSVNAANKHCTYDNKTLDHNTSILDNQRCQNCTCYNGLTFCLSLPNCKTEIENNVVVNKKTCLTNLRNVVLHGAKWSPDHCTNCTCEDGEVRCIAHFCETNHNICEQIDFEECNRHCQYGLRQLTNGCHLCECNLNRQFLDIVTHEKNITEDDIYFIVNLYNTLDRNVNKTSYYLINNTMADDNSHSFHYWSNVLIGVGVVILCIVFSVLILFLIRHSKSQSTRMDVCKSHDLKKYVNVPSYDDTNLNASYKYTTEYNLK